MTKKSTSSKKGLNITPPKTTFWLSLAAFLVSLASLVVSVRQTDLAAEQKEASVWPYLEFGTATTNKEFSFTIQNKGIGPALIKKIEIQRQGKIYRDFFHLMADMNDSTYFRHSYASLSNLVLSPQESRDLIHIQDSVAVKGLFEKFVQDLSYKVAYSSVYGKLWLLKQDTTIEINSLEDFSRY